VRSVQAVELLANLEVKLRRKTTLLECGRQNCS
jgi:hypothetical protein